MSPAATPSTALPARAAANAASRPFTGTLLSWHLSLDGVYVGQDRQDRVQGRLVPGLTGRDQRMIDAGGGQLAQVGEERGRARLRVLAEVEVRGHGLLDRGEVAARVRAVPAEHAELVRDVVAELRALHVEQVAGVRVLGHQAQGLALAAAADQDRRVRPPHRVRRVERAGQLIVPPLVRALVAAPHLVRNLEYFLEPLEALSQRGERDAEALGLEGGARAGWLDVPRCARPDAEDRPAAGHHVEGGNSFYQHSRMAVGDRGHQRAELDLFGKATEEGERRVRLGHGRLGRQPGQPDLEEVVHDPQAVRARLVRRRGDPGYDRADLLHRPGEHADADTELHGCLPRMSLAG